MRDKLSLFRFQRISTIWQEILAKMSLIKEIFNKGLNELNFNNFCFNIDFFIRLFVLLNNQSYKSIRIICMKYEEDNRITRVAQSVER